MKKRTPYLFLVGIVIVFAFPPVWIFAEARGRIVESVEVAEPTRVAIVFGAGLVNKESPSDVLRDRLIVAVQLYKANKVEKILVSGDNRFQDYNEPRVMQETLVNEFGIPEGDVVADFAGRRTYDTCIRAKTIWGVDEAMLVTQDFHLPRAIWTCERLDIESRGVSASLQPYVYEASYRAREIPAIYKAALDVFLIHPDYIRGEEEISL